MNDSNGGNTTTSYPYTGIRLLASVSSFVLLAFFNLVINYTILSVEKLRNQARFVLIFHLLFSGLVYFGMSSIFYLQSYLAWQVPKGFCFALITGLMTSASSILLTLTFMALDRYCAICFPLKYSSLSQGYQPWITGLLAWILALPIPLWLVLKENKNFCDLAAKPKGGEVVKILLVTCCSLLILFTYVQIFREGRRLGVLNRRNRIGTRTISMHGLQLAVYILPNFVNFIIYTLSSKNQDLFKGINYTFFSFAQCISPVIYGLRKEELCEQLHLKFPCMVNNLKAFLEWTASTKKHCFRQQEYSQPQNGSSV
ncbi:odorant receptor 131-2 [Erpetoichthys calabaricus]|uniref:Zgc:194312 n=1 Tax=Erpetoichthys calabaricus TaxID=27687 RepID=A0A8C4SED8_ERPCA|nr:odorant receptor 131-2 [Erpetoichthys calabaricus]